MSFFKRLFGSRTAEEERAEADRLFDGGEYFDARLAYERAIDKAARGGEATRALREGCADRAATCLERLAEARIADAVRLASEGQRS